MSAKKQRRAITGCPTPLQDLCCNCRRRFVLLAAADGEPGTCQDEVSDEAAQFCWIRDTILPRKEKISASPATIEAPAQLGLVVQVFGVTEMIHQLRLLECEPVDTSWPYRPLEVKRLAVWVITFLPTPPFQNASYYISSVPLASENASAGPARGRCFLSDAICQFTGRAAIN
mmetsp:Transcript_112074/g.205292  ORF Transcript_112074/g.205292 Transcript_112074/m.205292 type:complete len:173 (+) Transcript_112074:820-1338(+)